MVLIAIVVFVTAGFILGYAVCSMATWARVHQQESNIRALSNNIAVMQGWAGEVPLEWITDQLESMVAKDYR